MVGRREGPWQRRWQIAALWFAILAWTSGARALEPERGPQEHTQQVWQSHDGLPHDTVFAITQADDGYLWLGTGGGPVRFDGVAFRPLQDEQTPQVNARVSALQAASDGRLWVGAMAAVLRFDRGQPSLRRALSGRVQAFEREGDRLWVGTSRGLHLLTKEGWQDVALGGDTAVSALRRDAAGRLWIGTDTGLMVLEQGRVRPFPTGRPAARVNALAEDARGRLWIGTTEGLLRLEGDRVSPVEDDEALARARITALLVDRDGLVWVGTTRALLRSTAVGFERVEREDGLRDADVQALFEDREGNIWVGFTGGLLRLNDRALPRLALPAEAYGRGVVAACPDLTGRLWVGTREDGAFALAPGADGLSVQARAVRGSRVRTMWPEPSGDILLAGNQALVRWRDGREERLHGGDKPIDNVRALHVGRDGTIWAGTRFHGLARVRGGEVTWFDQTSGLDAHVNAVVEDARGVVWAGGAGGLSVIEGERVRRLGAGDGYVGHDVASLHADGDVLWIGTLGRGLVRFANGRFTTFREALTDDFVMSIVDDGAGQLWLATNRGLTRVAKQELHAVASGQIQTLTAARFVTTSRRRPMVWGGDDGHPAACRGGDGKLYFPIGGGVVAFDPRRVRINQVPPPVSIETVTADGRATTSTRFAPGTRVLGISYVGVSLQEPNKVRYRYRLGSADVAWIDAGEARSVQLANLAAGAYTFVVQASNNDGLWSPTGASFAFVLEAPFHQTTWFRLLVLATIVASMIGVNQLRLRNARLKYAAIVTERARVARQIHDSLLQAMTSVALQIDAELAQRPSPEVKQAFAPVRALAAESLVEARRLLRDLRDVETRPVDLVRALGQAARRLAGDGKAAIEVRVEGPAQALPPNVETELFWIAREAITNALRHAAPRRIDVVLSFTADAVELTVRDDGTGFDANAGAPEGHFGLTGMRERASSIGATCDLVTNPGQGTTVRVIVPQNGRRRA